MPRPAAEARRGADVGHRHHPPGRWASPRGEEALERLLGRFAVALPRPRSSGGRRQLVCHGAERQLAKALPAAGNRQCRRAGYSRGEPDCSSPSSALPGGAASLIVGEDDRWRSAASRPRGASQCRAPSATAAVGTKQAWCVAAAGIFVTLRAELACAWPSRSVSRTSQPSRREPGTTSSDWSRPTPPARYTGDCLLSRPSPQGIYADRHAGPPRGGGAPDRRAVAPMIPIVESSRAGCNALPRSEVARPRRPKYRSTASVAETRSGA